MSYTFRQTVRIHFQYAFTMFVYILTTIVLSILELIISPLIFVLSLMVNKNLFWIVTKWFLNNSSDWPFYKHADTQYTHWFNNRNK